MKTIQEYIDERPLWPDGTQLSSAPMTQMQWLIWSLAAAGKFFVGYVVFMTGVTLPLISREFDISSAQNGLISAASLVGILLGALGLGGMSDRFGRKPMFIFEMIIFVAFLLLLILCSNFLSVVVCLFGLGLALGCDYPTAHMIISENIPSVTRGRLVLAAFGFQALGALGGTAVGLLVLSSLADLSAWRWMYATAIIPALAVTIGRFYVTESANWLPISGWHSIPWPLLKASARIADSRLCSHDKTDVPRSLPRSHGSCRILDLRYRDFYADNSGRYDRRTCGSRP